MGLAVAHAHTRRELERLISSSSQLRLAASAADRAELADARLDAVVLDFAQLEATPLPGAVPVVVVGLDEAPGFRARAIGAGALDYVALDEAADALVPVVVARLRDARAETGARVDRRRGARTGRAKR